MDWTEYNNVRRRIKTIDARLVDFGGSLTQEEVALYVRWNRLQRIAELIQALREA